MAFFNSAIGVLQTLVVALGAGLGVWGAINLLEGYGNDNPGAKSQGMKQLMAGGGVALIGITLVPLLSGLKPSPVRLSRLWRGRPPAYLNNTACGAPLAGKERILHRFPV